VARQDFFSKNGRSDPEIRGMLDFFSLATPIGNHKRLKMKNFVRSNLFGEFLLTGFAGYC